MNFIRSTQSIFSKQEVNQINNQKNWKKLDISTSQVCYFCGCTRREKYGNVVS